MTAAKFLDFVARLPGCAGEDADAAKAYTQAILAHFEGDTEATDSSFIEFGIYSLFAVLGFVLLLRTYGHSACPLKGLFNADESVMTLTVRIE